MRPRSAITAVVIARFTVDLMAAARLPQPLVHDLFRLPVYVRQVEVGRFFSQAEDVDGEAVGVAGEPADGVAATRIVVGPHPVRQRRLVGQLDLPRVALVAEVDLAIGRDHVRVGEREVFEDAAGVVADRGVGEPVAVVAVASGRDLDVDIEFRLPEVLDGGRGVVLRGPGRLLGELELAFLRLDAGMRDLDAADHIGRALRQFWIVGAELLAEEQRAFLPRLEQGADIGRGQEPVVESPVIADEEIERGGVGVEFAGDVVPGVADAAESGGACEQFALGGGEVGGHGITGDRAGVGGMCSYVYYEDGWPAVK